MQNINVLLLAYVLVLASNFRDSYFCVKFTIKNISELRTSFSIVSGGTTSARFYFYLLY